MTGYELDLFLFWNDICFALHWIQTMFKKFFSSVPQQPDCARAVVWTQYHMSACGCVTICDRQICSKAIWNAIIIRKALDQLKSLEYILCACVCGTNDWWDKRLWNGLAFEILSVIWTHFYSAAGGGVHHKFATWLMLQCLFRSTSGDNSQTCIM